MMQLIWWLNIDVDEAKYDSSKLWTYKLKQERQQEKPSPDVRKGNWSSYKKGGRMYQNRLPFDGAAGNSTPVAANGRTVVSPGVDVNFKQEPTSKSDLSASNSPGNPPSNQGGNGSNGSQGRFASSRRCYYCGKYGHFKRDCPKFKQVNVAHVPSLSKVPNNPITVPGQVGEMEITEMLCDSGATISVVAEASYRKGLD